MNRYDNCDVGELLLLTCVSLFIINLHKEQIKKLLRCSVCKLRRQYYRADGRQRDCRKLSVLNI